jgi:hypothetical protein
LAILSDWLRTAFDYRPFELFTEIGKAILADPVVRVLGRVTFIDITRLRRQFAPTELAVVMIPVSTKWCVLSPAKPFMLEVSLLTLQSPIE